MQELSMKTIVLVLEHKKNSDITLISTDQDPLQFQGNCMGSKPLNFLFSIINI